MGELYGTKEDIIVKSRETIEKFFKGKNSEKFFNMISGVINMAYNAGIEEGSGDFSTYQRRYNEGYQKGYNTAKAEEQHKKKNVSQDIIDVAYQQGLNVAWEYAKQIVCDIQCGGMPSKAVHDIFGCYSYETIFEKFSIYEVCKMIEDYKAQELLNKFEVGDEVQIILSGSHGVVIKEYIDEVDVLFENGDVFTQPKKDVCKSGRHFTIFE